MDKFAPLIVTQEFWSAVGFWILVAGLTGDMLILAIPEHRGWLEKSLAAVFTIVVIIGCAFEHIADGKISDLVTREEHAAAVEIAQDKATAQTAAREAGKLGVTVKTLPAFVAEKERDFNAQFNDFKTFSNAEEKRDTAIITDLNRDKADLD